MFQIFIDFPTFKFCETQVGKWVKQALLQHTLAHIMLLGNDPDPIGKNNMVFIRDEIQMKGIARFKFNLKIDEMLRGPPMIAWV